MTSSFALIAELLDALEEMEDNFGHTMQRKVERGEIPQDAGGWLAVQQARAAIAKAGDLMHFFVVKLGSAREPRTCGFTTRSMRQADAYINTVDGHEFSHAWIYEVPVQPKTGAITVRSLTDGTTRVVLDVLVAPSDCIGLRSLIPERRTA